MLIPGAGTPRRLSHRAPVRARAAPERSSARRPEWRPTGACRRARRRGQRPRLQGACVIGPSSSRENGGIVSRRPSGFAAAPDGEEDRGRTDDGAIRRPDRRFGEPLRARRDGCAPDARGARPDYRRGGRPGRIPQSLQARRTRRAGRLLARSERSSTPRGRRSRQGARNAGDRRDRAPGRHSAPRRVRRPRLCAAQARRDADAERRRSGRSAGRGHGLSGARSRSRCAGSRQRRADLRPWPRACRRSGPRFRPSFAGHAHPRSGGRAEVAVAARGGRIAGRARLGGLAAPLPRRSA